MNVNDFEETLKRELEALNITLLDLYPRRKYLCVDWSFEDGRRFTSCFNLPDSYIQDRPEEVLYKMVKRILFAISYADNIVSEIIQIKRNKK